MASAKSIFFIASLFDATVFCLNSLLLLCNALILPTGTRKRFLHTLVYYNMFWHRQHYIYIYIYVYIYWSVEMNNTCIDGSGFADVMYWLSRWNTLQIIIPYLIRDRVVCRYVINMLIVAWKMIPAAAWNYERFLLIIHNCVLWCLFINLFIN